MGNIIHITADILIILWAIGFFFLSMGFFIHILLLFAIIGLVLRIIQQKREVENYN
jgi:hypothetical protein